MKPIQFEKYGFGYRFKEPTTYSAAHLGTDYMTPTGTPVYAPFDGVSKINSFATGGTVIDYHTNGYVMRFMHLSSIVKTGQCAEGELIAYTGNTGTLTTGPHLHIDISKGNVNIYNINNFLNPETFNWGKDNMTIDEYEKSPSSLKFRGDADDVVFIFRKADNQSLPAKKLNVSSVNPEYLYNEMNKKDKTIGLLNDQILKLKGENETLKQENTTLNKKIEGAFIEIESKDKEISRLSGLLKTCQDNLLQIPPWYMRVWEWIKETYNDLKSLKNNGS